MRMHLNIVVFGLSLSSSWGNGHATTYRSLLRALAQRGHNIVFLERDVPWYADTRDLTDPDYATLLYYSDVGELEHHRSRIDCADLVIVGSYVPDGIAVADWVLKTATGTVAFYDIDTPVTLADLERGACAYLSPPQISRYDLYLSFTGGPLLKTLKQRWRARTPVAFYCSADPELHVRQRPARRWALGYLGTYSADRQPALERLLFEPARNAPHLQFVVAGAQYPDTISWPDNVMHVPHVPPSEHAHFYASVDWTLNITRSDMRAAGYSPSVRLFEAAACGTPVISDPWPGLESFFEPGVDIIVADDGDDVLAALCSSESFRLNVGERAWSEVTAAHTSAHRAAQLEALLLGDTMQARPNALGREERSRF